MTELEKIKEEADKAFAEKQTETTSTETGDQLSQTFSEIAQQYRTEIKVNPQSMIIIFY